jgi:hypothetical protein
MRMLHDSVTRSSIEQRLKAMRPEAQRKWGKMTSDQMLWHLNQFLSFALGEGGGQPPKSSVFSPVFRFVLLYMPWPKSAPTNPNALAQGSYDFAAERERCLTLIDRFASRPLDGPWPVDPSFGPVTGRFTSSLQAKHIDYHFRQFNA